MAESEPVDREAKRGLFRKVLFVRIEFCREEKGFLRDEPDDFAPLHRDAEFFGFLLDFLECGMRRGLMIIRQVDGNLRDIEAFHQHTHRFYRFQCARNFDAVSLRILQSGQAIQPVIGVGGGYAVWQRL